MSKKMYSLTLLSTLLSAGMFVTHVMAADKVIVIPLNSSSKAVGNATPSNVILDKTFSGDAGVGITGTMPDNGAVTIIPTNSYQAISAGYHNGSGAVTGDPDLASANIKRGTTIFGVAGDSNVVDSSSGDAVSGEIMDGKKAWVDGSEITGSFSTQSLSDTSTIVAAGAYAATTLDTVDSDLVSANIKSGTNIFGVTGDSKVVDSSSGDAVSGEIMDGKKAWVDGSEIIGSMPTQSLSDTSTTLAAGFYATTTLDLVDSDLKPANIKSDTTIFGVTGDYSGDGVAKTGQESCTFYDGSWQWDADCTNGTRPPGQDGELQLGTAWPVTRFEDNGNGTVTDNLTGLIWLKNANCTGSILSWEDALTWANGLADGDCGLSDGSEAGAWRVPNVTELESLIDRAYYNPVLSDDTREGQWISGDPNSAFSGVQSLSYWSSTSYAGGVNLAWYVSLYGGGVKAGDKSTNYNVWLVRGGQ